MKLGIYQHYKGGRYEVIGVAKDEATLEEMVVYQALSDQSLWVRPLKVFTENVKVDGMAVPRFRLIK